MAEDFKGEMLSTSFDEVNKSALQAKSVKLGKAYIKLCFVNIFESENGE